MVLAKFWDRRSFPNPSQNMWSTITHDHDRQKLEKYDLRSLMIVIWLEMIGDHDPIRLTLVGDKCKVYNFKTTYFENIVRYFLFWLDFSLPLSSATFSIRDIFIFSHCNYTRCQMCLKLQCVSHLMKDDFWTVFNVH